MKAGETSKGVVMGLVERACECCTCDWNDKGTVATQDPACHFHGRHGLRGCAKHNQTPVACKCGCKPNVAKAAEQEARAARLAHKLKFAGDVGIRTTDTPEELAALAKTRAANAAAAAEAQVAQMATLMVAAQARINGGKP